MSTCAAQRAALPLPLWVDVCVWMDGWMAVSPGATLLLLPHGASKSLSCHVVSFRERVCVFPSSPYASHTVYSPTLPTPPTPPTLQCTRCLSTPLPPTPYTDDAQCEAGLKHSCQASTCPLAPPQPLPRERRQREAGPSRHPTPPFPSRGQGTSERHS